jgi:flagellar hook-length control protein FliK
LANDKITSGLQSISSPLGSRGWAEEFSQKITWMGTQQNQVAELHLNPPNLGPLDIVLKISDNQATALFTSPHSAVRDAVENALPRLREMLADNGIMLGNTTVSDQSPRDRSADGLMNHDSGALARREASDDALEAAGLSLTTAQTVPMRRHNGMVDTFA